MDQHLGSSEGQNRMGSTLDRHRTGSLACDSVPEM